ncbi:MAG: PHP domain-containing protein, partial [Halobacteriaceae archaeon]
MSIYADLHIHTTNSDGTLTLEDLPAVANEYDISVVAVTDHDRIHPDISDPIVYLDDVTVIHGIELRVQTSTQRIDLLGYGVTPTSSLREEI